jgi:hypothetical protein
MRFDGPPQPPGAPGALRPYRTRLIRQVPVQQQARFAVRMPEGAEFLWTDGVAMWWIAERGAVMRDRVFRLVTDEGAVETTDAHLASWKDGAVTRHLFDTGFAEELGTDA